MSASLELIATDSAFVKSMRRSALLSGASDSSENIQSPMKTLVNSVLPVAFHKKSYCARTPGKFDLRNGFSTTSDWNV